MAGATTSTYEDDMSNGNIGGVCTTLEMKIVDIPEMDYLTTDKDDKGNPTPRGELCFRGV